MHISSDKVNKVIGMLNNNEYSGESLLAVNTAVALIIELSQSYYSLLNDNTRLKHEILHLEAMIDD